MPRWHRNIASYGDLSLALLIEIVPRNQYYHGTAVYLYLNAFILYRLRINMLNNLSI